MKATAEKRKYCLLGLLLGLIIPGVSYPSPAFTSELMTGVVSEKLSGDSFAETKSKVVPCLAQLKVAERFCGRYTGFGASQTKDFLAYEKALSLGGAIRTDLEELLKTASPAGRLYAAILLERLDPPAGREALKQMLTDNSTVTFSFFGCGGGIGPLWMTAKTLIEQPNVRIDCFETIDPKLAKKPGSSSISIRLQRKHQQHRR